VVEEEEGEKKEIVHDATWHEHGDRSRHIETGAPYELCEGEVIHGRRRDPVEYLLVYARLFCGGARLCAYGKAEAFVRHYSSVDLVGRLAYELDCVASRDVDGTDTFWTMASGVCAPL